MPTSHGSTSIALLLWSRRPGSICDLPGYMLDEFARAVRTVHPSHMPRALAFLLVSGRFARSNHPLLRGRDAASLRRYYTRLDS